MTAEPTVRHQPQRLLVTGGAGFIGGNFVQHWLTRHPDHQLVVLDALTYAASPASVTRLRALPGCHFVHGDINDRPLVERLLREHRVDTLVHFAAESHVDRAIRDPDACLRSNVHGTQALLEAARTVWLDDPAWPRPHRFHHVSTDEVYGDLPAGAPPWREDAPYAPSSPYAASKAAADHLVRAWHRTYGLQVTLSNCTNNYGPLQFPEKLIPLVILNVLHGRPLPLYGDGHQQRDWLHVADHCAGIERCLRHGRPGATYHLGGDCERSNGTLVAALCGQLDARFAAEPTLATRFPDAPPATGRPAHDLVRHVPDRPGHDRRYALDCSLARRELGFQPAIGLADGLARTLDWYLTNEDWWQPILSGEYRQWLETHYA